PARAMVCECERDADTNLGQALHLTGGSIVHDKLASPTGRIARLLAGKRTDAEVVEELFQATLSRHPTPAESARLLRRFARAGADGRRRVAEDVLYALLNHREFLFQH